MSFRRSLFILTMVVCCCFSAQANQQLEVCDTYRAKSDELQCSNDDYLLEFGDYYCRKFVEKNHRFTNEGQVILARIRACLVREIDNEQNLTCDNAKKLAQKHHYRCYLESGFCDMGLYDRIQIGWIVRKELFDPGLSSVMEEINLACTLAFD